MRIIHIFDSKGAKVDSIYATSLEDFAKEPSRFFSAWKESYSYSDVEFQNPIIDSKGVREITREELVAKGIEIPLGEGEIVLDGRLVSIEKPSQWHKWSGTEWVLDLDEIKEERRNTFKKELEEKRYSHFEYEGNLYQMGKNDIPNFEKIKMALDILKQFEDVDMILNLLEHLDSNLVAQVRKQKEKMPVFTKEHLLASLEGYKTKWRLVDNSMVEISYKKVKEILLAFIFRDGALNNQYNKINGKLLEANTVEEIEKISWE